MQRVARWGAVWPPGVEAQPGTVAGTVQGFSFVGRLEGVDELHDDFGVGFHPGGERCGGVAFAGGAQGCAGNDVGDRRQDRQTLLAGSVELLLSFDVGGADGLDAVHLAPHFQCLAYEPLDGPQRVASGREARDRRRPRPPGCGVVVEVPQLVEVPDAQEAVSGFEGVVEEREGPISWRRW